MRRHLIRDGAEIGRIMEYLVDRGTDVDFFKVVRGALSVVKEGNKMKDRKPL